MDTKALRQKILDLAIRGKLVPQDPNDEPASVLLERIREEKERLIQEGKIKRSKKTATADTPQYPNELPKGWATTTIEEISVVERGGNFAKKDFVKSGYPCIHYGQIHTKFGDTTYDVISYLDRKLASKQRLAHPKDIIMAVTSENMQDVCKCTAWMGDYDVAVGGHTAIIRHWVSPLFLVYYFRSDIFNEQKVEYAHGSKVIEMSPLQMSSFFIPLPPLAEQERIVAEIQRLFSLIDLLDNEKKDIAELIKNTKSKILSLAILGKLVEQRSDDEPASETLKRINPAWQPCDTSHYPNLPNGWTICKLEDVVDYEQPQNYIVSSTDYSDEYPIPVLTAGKSFIIGYTNETFGIQTNIPVIIFDDFTTESKYVDFPFKVKSSAMKILHVKNGVNIRFIHLIMSVTKLIGDTHKRYWISEYSQLPILLPPVVEQDRIVQVVDNYFEKLDEIERLIQ